MMLIPIENAETPIVTLCLTKPLSEMPRMLREISIISELSSPSNGFPLHGNICNKQQSYYTPFHSNIRLFRYSDPHCIRYRYIDSKVSNQSSPGDVEIVNMDQTSGKRKGFDQTANNRPKKYPLHHYIQNPLFYITLNMTLQLQ